jgi:glycosyltransferase involved in cell wall biosynthesis
MRIGIDARLIDETGVGRYIRNLLLWLSKLDTQNEYIIYLTPEAFDSFQLPNLRWEKRKVNIRWHTIQEQLLLPLLYIRDRIQLLHVPYFTIPILFPGKIVSTIHDLTILHERTGKATTLPRYLYTLKHIGYRIILSFGIFRSSRIIAVSHAVAKEVIRRYHLHSSSVVVTYEGVDECILTVHPLDPNISHPYFLYVGNVYPHKNAEILLDAFEQIYNQKMSVEKVILIFVGKIDYFYRRIQQRVVLRFPASSVVFLGHVSDEVLAGLYHYSVATVFPSKMEGFGLPAIESLALGCPVIVSDIPVFREVLDYPGVTFVQNNDPEAWAKALIYALHDKEKRNIWKTDREKNKFLEKFSWKKMAEKTLSVYEDSYRIRPD